MHALVQAQRAQYGMQEVTDPAAACAGKYGRSGDMLRRLGYRELVVDAAVGYRQVDGRLLVEVSNDVMDMYELSLSLTFDGMPTPQAVMMGAFQPRLVEGRFEYTWTVRSRNA